MNTPHYTSPAHALLHNGIAVFNNIGELDGFKVPMTLSMTLLVVCTRGQISATIDYKYHRMSASSILVLRSGHVLNDIQVSVDFRGYFMAIESERLESIMPLSAGYMASYLVYFSENPIVKVGDAEIEQLIMLHTMLNRKLHQAPIPYSHQAFNSLCEALYYETLGIYSNAKSQLGRVPSRKEELLSRFIHLVDEHYRQERSVSFYASQLYLSPKHLSSVIKSASGITAGDWIDKKVVHEAKILLRSTPKTIQQISHELNFSNQSFFGKFFKHLTGMTPREYRMKLPEREIAQPGVN